MYGYGSSARAATGKRGHGGRNYRPPPERKGGAAPPPLKQCDCLVEIDIPEYQRMEERRSHVCFGGREMVQETIKAVRSIHLCHLEIPGRTKAGPVGIVGKTVEQVIPATFYVMHKLLLEIRQVETRIHRNVKTQEPSLEGTIQQIDRIGVFFESPTVSVAACRLESSSTLQNLQAVLENLQFRDAANQFEIVADGKMIFAIGETERVKRLVGEIQEGQEP